MDNINKRKHKGDLIKSKDFIKKESTIIKGLRTINKRLNKIKGT